MGLFCEEHSAVARKPEVFVELELWKNESRRRLIGNCTFGGSVRTAWMNLIF
jgi:hypothetical protein